MPPAVRPRSGRLVLPALAIIGALSIALAFAAAPRAFALAVAAAFVVVGALTFSPLGLVLSRGVDALSFALGIVADWLVMGAALISAGNAISRYLFAASSNAWLEIQWYMFGGIVLLGASYTLKVNEHVRVDILYSNVSDRARLWIDTLGLIFFLLPAMTILAVMSWPEFLTSYLQHETSSNAGGLIRWPVKLLLPLGFGVLVLQGLSELSKRIAALRGELQLQTEYEKPLQ